MNESQELLDLVDADDRVIDTVTRGNFNHQAHQNGYVRAAEGFILNRDGELWIPRRTAHKTHAPNGLDFSVSEHVASGESYLQAIVRGFKEELLLTVDVAELDQVGVIKPTNTMPWFAAIHIYKSDTAPEFNREDFTEGMWLLPAKILAMIEAGEPAKAGLAPAIKFAMGHFQQS